MPRNVEISELGTLTEERDRERERRERGGREREKYIYYKR